jgi:hypothetical protein
MVFLEDYTPYEPLSEWFDPDWIPEHGNKAWIIDFLSPADCEIRISSEEMTYDIWLNGNLVYGTTLLNKNLL